MTDSSNVVPLVTYGETATELRRLYEEICELQVKVTFLSVNVRTCLYLLSKQRQIQPAKLHLAGLKEATFEVRQGTKGVNQSVNDVIEIFENVNTVLTTELENNH